MMQLHNFKIIIFVVILNSEISSGSQYVVPNLLHSLSEFFQSFRFVEYIEDSFWLTSDISKADTEQCNKHLEYWSVAFNKSELWSLQMVDSWGKIPSGLLSGNVIELGSFDECLDINEFTDIGLIQGQYCFQPISIILEEPNVQSKVAIFGGDSLSSQMDFGIGSCFPTSCSPEYFHIILNSFLQSYKMTIMPIDPKLLCFTNDKVDVDTMDITVTVLLSLIVICMALSTIYDLYTRHWQLEQKQIFLAFSVYSNGAKLFSCKQNKSQDMMNCLNGIRVLSIVWIIYGHVYSMTAYGVTVNPSALEKWVKSYHSMIILSGPLGVDTFLLLSGLLVTWNVFKELQKHNGKLNIPLMYLHRYLRLTPSYVALILFGVSYFKHLGVGPFSNIVQKYIISDNCAEYWWSSLLYIQNYYNPDSICLQHTWYLSVDMQLFILSPIILIPLWKWGRNFMPVIATLLFLSIGCTFAIFYGNDFSVSFIKKGGVADTDQMSKIYFATHTRMGAWLVGVILAYNLLKFRNKKLILPRYAVTIGWIMAIGTLLAVVFGQYEMQQLEYIEDTLESSIYTALYRIGWCIGLAWIIFACVLGYGGYVNHFLSMAMWLPLARLSYAMYLLHIMLQTIRVKSLKVGIYYNEWNVVQTFWGDFGTTVTVSVVWVLAFESPILIIEKLLFNRLRKQPANAPLTNETAQ